MSPTWLLWDGECEFCRCLSAKLVQIDHRQVLTIIPYQRAAAPPMTPALHVLCEQQVQLVTASGVRLAGADAILFALETAGWHAGVARLLRKRPFRWAASTGYWLVARNRGRLSRFCR